MKRFILGLALTAGLLAASADARATSLSPGSSVGSLGSVSISGSFVSADSGSNAISYTDGSTVFNGTLYYAVVKESNGNLDFLYQVSGKSGSTDIMDTIKATAFQNGLTTGGTNAYNVGTLSSLSNITGTNPGFTTSGTLVAPSGASLSSVGGVLKFDFTGNNGVGAGQTSDIVVVQTSASQAASNRTTVSDGGSQTFTNTFAPTPEPASLVLLGSCLAGLGMTGAYRRWKAKPAVN